MRIRLFVLGLVFGAAGIGLPAHARDYPWCAVYSEDGPVYNCGFVSRAQCMQTVAGMDGSCRPNELYRPAPARRHRLTRRLHADR